METLRLTVAAAALATTALASASSAMAKDSDHDWSELDLLFLIWSQSSNPFFDAVLPALAALPAELARRMVGLQEPASGESGHEPSAGAAFRAPPARYSACGKTHGSAHLGRHGSPAGTAS